MENCRGSAGSFASGAARAGSSLRGLFEIAIGVADVESPRVSDAFADNVIASGSTKIISAKASLALRDRYNIEASSVPIRLRHNSKIIHTHCACSMRRVSEGWFT